jgi:SH3-like domain-containing protein
MQSVRYITFILSFLLIVNIVNAEDKFLSLKKNKVNVRYGPGFDYPIKFIYKKKNLPIKQIDKKGNFRRIIDQKNNSGWVHISQLKKVNSIIVLESKILFEKSSNFSKPIAKLQKGRLLIIISCKKKWCKVKTEGYLGWIILGNTWGFE